MVRRVTGLMLPLVLAALAGACARVAVSPPGKPVYITVFVYPAPAESGGCAAVTIPQHAFAQRGNEIVWDISSGTCPAAGAVTVDIDSTVIEMTRPDAGENVKEREKGRQANGRVKSSAAFGPHKYKIRLASGFVEDPRIDIWP